MNLLKKILKYPVVLAFFLFIFLFTAVDLVKPDREYSEFENKYLTQRPEFTLASFLNNEWTSKYETYLNDQFVLRDDWITLKSICESMLLKIENNGIAYGADDYLSRTMGKVEMIARIRAVLRRAQRYRQADSAAGMH